jgi:ABC-2 type transport system ATP-binding protein
VLTLQNVTRGYPDHPVLRDATLELEPGRVACLVGGNGAGKTTLLRVAVGLLEPEVGRVSLDGLDPTQDRRAYQRRLGYVPAGNGGLYARLKVHQHLALWSDLALVGRAQRADRVAAAISAFALEDLAANRVDRLSTGQRQRVRLAMGFLHDPDVVLLDEPHASLDDAGLSSLSAALEKVTNRGGAVMWCAPKFGNVELRADDHIALRDGRLSQA